MWLLKIDPHLLYTPTRVRRVYARARGRVKFFSEMQYYASTRGRRRRSRAARGALNYLIA